MMTKRRIHAALKAMTIVAIFAVNVIQFNNVLAAPGDPEGLVKFFVIADSGMDKWTSDPDPDTQQWMRENYSRMLTYTPYFDSRLSWYPNAWFYKDAYAIYTDSSVLDTHAEWVLRDANGTMLYIPYGCSGGTCPQYAADFGSPAFRTWWIDKAESSYVNGYKGIYLDDVNFEWRVGDGSGNIVKPIDPRTNREMTLADWRRYFAEFLEEVRVAFPRAEIAHNMIWFAEPTDDPSILRGIAAADYLILERGITDSGIRGGSGTYGFETFLALIDRAHAVGTNVVMLDDDDDSVVDRDYELAFYFLINNGGDLVAADGDRSRMSPDNFWSGYHTDIGYAKGDRYKWNGLFRRDFDCGMVLVNQPDSSTISVNLGDNYTDLSGKSVAQVTLASATGQVLTQPCQASIKPMPPSELQITN